jgi:hypothetical protein
MRAVLTILLLCALLLVGHVRAQDGDSSAQGRHSPLSPPPPTPAEVELQQQAAKQRNKERYARVKKDTDQLLELATQLKKSVDEASDQTLSLEVIRKAEQIEKLAKQVRQKMAGD